jgi:hypothetical protein
MEVDPKTKALVAHLALVTGASESDVVAEAVRALLAAHGLPLDDAADGDPASEPPPGASRGGPEGRR